MGNDSPSSDSKTDPAPEADSPKTPLFLSAPETLNTTLALTTGTHRYSKLLILQCAASMFAGSFNMHAISFVNSLPKFICMVDGREVLSTEDQGCLNPDTCRTQYFYDGWVKLYGMTCQQKATRVFFVSLIFVLNASMFFTLNTLGDLLGRKAVLRIATFVAIIGTFLMYYIDHYGMKIILFGLVTGTYSVFQMMFTLGMKEAMPTTTPYNAYMNAIVNCSYNVGPVLLSFLAMVLPFDTLCLASVVLITLCTIPNLFTFFEPPVYLYRKKRLAECYDNMVGIAKVNSLEVSQSTLETQLLKGERDYLASTKTTESAQPVELKPLEERAVSKDLRETQEPLVPKETQTQQTAQSNPANASLKWVTVVLCYWCSCMYLVSYGTLISFEKSGMDNLFANMILLGIASFIGYGVCIKLPKDVPRIRTISLIMSCLLGVSFFILFLDAVSGESTFISFIKSVCIVFIMPILVCMGFSVMYLYLPDVFPVTNRGMGIGIVIFIGKSLGGGSSAYIANFMNKMSLNPIAGCAMPSLLLLVLLKTIPQN